jgi:hypothetical protein
MLLTITKIKLVSFREREGGWEVRNWKEKACKN